LWDAPRWWCDSDPSGAANQGKTKQSKNRAGIDTVEAPTPGAGEIRVRVKAAALNRADLLVLAGHQHGSIGGVGAIVGLECSSNSRTTCAVSCAICPCLFQLQSRAPRAQSRAQSVTAYLGVTV
jgi:hypothetical protein